MNATLAALGPLARVALHDLVDRRRDVDDDERHLLEAEAWLCRAHDASSDGGVSYGYSWRGGWRPSYPETSGYIATTFLRLARDRDSGYAERARRILRWLTSIQKPDGAFGNPRFGDGGIVFDTGQILFGLVAGASTFGDEQFFHAARRAADWLTDVADDDGRWTRHEYLDTPHVYNTRTAWALARMHAVEPTEARERIARANLDWALACQRPNGLFDHCAFRDGDAPFTHTIAYAARGLLESGASLGDARYVAAARRAAFAVLAHLRDDGHLPSTIAVDGRPASASCCLTGNCQFAIVWMRLDAIEPDARLRRGAELALRYVRTRQDLTAPASGVRGGIKGSHPIWGRYACMTYPNWATKFFIDAMWLRKAARR